MQEKQLLEQNFITSEEWNLTPSRVKEIVVQQNLKIQELEKELQQLKDRKENLEEKVNRNSDNSNSPPSTDLNKPEKKDRKNRKRRKRGGQFGHKGHSRVLYEAEECTSIHEHLPKTCSCCGEELLGFDTSPYRHQVVDIPPIQLRIEEHRLHQLECHHCGEKTRAELPPEVEKSGYGPTVVGLVSIMSGVYRHSHRMIVSAMSDFFGVNLSLGSVNRLRSETSSALSAAVEEAKTYIHSAPVVCADETGFQQGNTDGKNPENRKAWFVWCSDTINQFF